jgi:hypothetical protein
MDGCTVSRQTFDVCFPGGFMKRVALGLLALATFFALARPARATPITGEVAFGGIGTYTATGVTFHPGMVFISDGSLGKMVMGSTVNVNNFDFGTAPGKLLFNYAKEPLKNR